MQNGENAKAVHFLLMLILFTELVWTKNTTAQPVYLLLIERSCCYSQNLQNVISRITYPTPIISLNMKKFLSLK